jgi:hypothetical protein
MKQVQAQRQFRQEIARKIQKINEVNSSFASSITSLSYAGLNQSKPQIQAQAFAEGEKNQTLLLSKKYQSSKITTTPLGVLITPQPLKRQASGFGAVTSFECKLSPVSENNVSKLSRPELLSNNSHYVQNRMSVIQEAPLAMSRYGKSNNISNYWKQHTLTEKKNAKLVGANPVPKPVVASLG